jgi:hypothetical protein
MQITLFKALKSINIDDAQATAVVDQLEEHLEKMIGDATKGLEAQNRALESKIDGLKNQGTTQFAFISVMLALVALATTFGPAIAKLVH